MRRIPFVAGEWYHCYTRGIDKRKTFETKKDYERFTELLYLANSATHKRRSDLTHLAHEDIFSRERGEQLVIIGAWCLMPNHFHIILKMANGHGSVSAFMLKLMNAYTKYFNIKNERNGNLFAVPFRATHINNDRYAQWATAYVHLNPAALVEPEWKEGRIKSRRNTKTFVTKYPYSSLFDYLEKQARAEKTILGMEGRELFGQRVGDFSDLIDAAQEYVNPWG